MNQNENILIINPLKDVEKLKALASEPRLQILDLIRRQTLNVNEIGEALKLPQSTVATHIAILENAQLISTEAVKAKKGNQKRCSTAFEQIIIQFPKEEKVSDILEVEMPIGIFTNYNVSSPCGLCSSDEIIGFLDIPDSFLNPARMKAGLLWCGTGTLEYKFPNNAFYDEREVKKLEFCVELSSEVPGTNSKWLSDITLWINNLEVGSWTSPGDFGDRRGKFTPSWWKLEGSQYGLLKTWEITDKGTFIDGEKISDITLKDLNLKEHHSIKTKIGVKEDAKNTGGMNIFGKGFGDYDQGIILRLYF
jgi:predicted transcriptional regulator